MFFRSMFSFVEGEECFFLALEEKLGRSWFFFMRASWSVSWNRSSMCLKALVTKLIVSDGACTECFFYEMRGCGF